MRAIILICGLLLVSTGAMSQTDDSTSQYAAPLGPAMTGTLRPDFDFFHGKFPVLAVHFHGKRYSLEGYHVPVNSPHVGFKVMYLTQLLLQLDGIQTCHETVPWHLVCFHPDGTQVLSPEKANLDFVSDYLSDIETEESAWLWVGTLTPNLYHLDGKFPLLTVYLKGTEFTLEGYSAPPGSPMDDFYLEYLRAKYVLEGHTFICKERPLWHLTCIDQYGKNLKEYL